MRLLRNILAELFYWSTWVLSIPVYIPLFLLVYIISIFSTESRLKVYKVLLPKNKPTK